MWSRVGTLLVRQGETTRGAAAFRIALRLDPNHSEAHRQLATLLAAHGSSAEAADHYERFLDLADKSRQDTRTRPMETLVLDRGEELQQSGRRPPIRRW
jgi:cytochrome c-type biogenesis protein CcmH/NrfG